MRRLLALINAISEWSGRGVKWLAFVLVLMVGFDVTRRYVFGRGMILLHELEFHLYAVLFLLGAAYTLLHQGHVRVDVLYTRFPKRGKAAVDLMGAVFFLFPFMVILMWYGWELFLDAWRIQERSINPGGVPALYVLKAVLPLSMLLLFLQGVAQFIRDLVLVVRGKEL